MRPRICAPLGAATLGASCAHAATLAATVTHSTHRTEQSEMRRHRYSTASTAQLVLSMSTAHWYTAPVLQRVSQPASRGPGAAGPSNVGTFIWTTLVWIVHDGAAVGRIWNGGNAPTSLQRF